MKLHSKRNWAFPALFFFAVANATGCSYKDSNIESEPSNGKIKVMLLGVYHFDNPGLDKHNLAVGDYFTDSRQREIEEVNDALAKFQPNKIFIELLRSEQSKIDSLYQSYLNGQFRLTSQNEVYQIGFKLAKKLELNVPHCIDAYGNWLGPYVDLIADTLNLSFYNVDRAKAKLGQGNRNKEFDSRTIKENLIVINQPKSILENNSYYNDLAMRVKDTVGLIFTNQDTTLIFDKKAYQMRSFDFKNIGIELVAEWYKRNFFIYRNILEASSKNDRIIVIVGAGHVRILQHLLEDNQKYEVISPLEYLGEEG